MRSGPSLDTFVAFSCWARTVFDLLYMLYMACMHVCKMLTWVQVPIGPWPKDPAMKEIGRYQREHMVIGVEPYTYGFIGKVLGWSGEECKVLTARVVNEIKDKSFHIYVKFYFVSGRKPEAAT